MYWDNCLSFLLRSLHVLYKFLEVIFLICFLADNLCSFNLYNYIHRQYILSRAEGHNFRRLEQAVINDFARLQNRHAAEPGSKFDWCVVIFYNCCAHAWHPAFLTMTCTTHFLFSTSIIVLRTCLYEPVLTDTIRLREFVSLYTCMQGRQACVIYAFHSP